LIYSQKNQWQKKFQNKKEKAQHNIENRKHLQVNRVETKRKSRLSLKKKRNLP
jgi:hypothetical protein